MKGRSVLLALSVLIEDPPGPLIESAAVSHNALYRHGRRQEVWLDK